jgi:hypothetical protein
MVKDCGTGITVGFAWEGPSAYVSESDVRRGSKPPTKYKLDDGCGLPDIESLLNASSTFCSEGKTSGRL